MDAVMQGPLLLRLKYLEVECTARVSAVIVQFSIVACLGQRTAYTLEVKANPIH